MTYDEMRIRQAWPYEVKIKHVKKVSLRIYLPGALPGQVAMEDMM